MMAIAGSFVAVALAVTLAIFLWPTDGADPAAAPDPAAETAPPADRPQPGTVSVAPQVVRRVAAGEASRWPRKPAEHRAAHAADGVGLDGPGPPVPGGHELVHDGARIPEPAPALPLEVVLDIQVKPDGAAVWFEGKFLGYTPMQHRVPRGEGTVEYEISKREYQTQMLSVARAEDAVLDAELEPAPKAPEVGPTRPRRPKGKRPARPVARPSKASVPSSTGGPAPTPKPDPPPTTPTPPTPGGTDELMAPGTVRSQGS